MEQHNDAGTMADLVRYRIETMEEMLRDTRILYEAKSYRSSANRSYYAIFNGISAVHAVSGTSYKRHKDAIANFNKDFVKTEIFPRSIGGKIMKAERRRNAGDYDAFSEVTRENALEQLEIAEEIATYVREYCAEYLK